MLEEIDLLADLRDECCLDSWHGSVTSHSRRFQPSNTELTGLPIPAGQRISISLPMEPFLLAVPIYPRIYPKSLAGIYPKLPES